VAAADHLDQSRGEPVVRVAVRVTLAGISPELPVAQARHGLGQVSGRRHDRRTRHSRGVAEQVAHGDLGGPWVVEVELGQVLDYRIVQRDLSGIRWKSVSGRISPFLDSAG